MIKLKTEDGKEYMLEFDRNSITYLERQGFALDKYSTQPMTQIPLLFRGAFFKHHKFAKAEEIDKIFENIKNKDKLMAALVDMVGESYETLVKDNDKGNVDWETV